MSKKQTTTQNTVTTPTNPDWVTNSVQGLTGKINDLSQLDPYSLVSGPNPLQNQAATTAANLSGSPWNFDAATGIVRGVANQPTPKVQAASLLDGLQNYMNPYTNDVVNTTLQGFDQQAGMQKAQDALDLANAGAWGGSGAAIKQAMTAQNLAQSRAATEAQLRDQAFNTGAGLSNTDAGRRQNASSQNALLALASRAQQLQAAGLLGDLSSQYDANQRGNATLQGTLGNDLRNITQQQLTAPISLLQTQAGLMGQMPFNLFNGQISNSTSTTKTSDPMGALGTLAMLAAAPFTGGASLMGGLGALGSGLAVGSGLAGTLGSIMPGLSAGLIGLGGSGGVTTLGDLKSGGFI